MKNLISFNVFESQTTDRSPLDNQSVEKGLKKKSEETGVPVGILRAVWRRGAAAWKSGHRPGAGQEQWAWARVNSFLTKGRGTWGKADKDLAKMVKESDQVVDKNELLNEGMMDTLKKWVDRGIVLAKEVWEGTKLEAGETREALRLVDRMLRGNDITDEQKEFLKAQSMDLLKVVPLVAVAGIPGPVPFTALFVLLGRKFGFDPLPNSHNKTTYKFTNEKSEHKYFRGLSKSTADKKLAQMRRQSNMSDDDPGTYEPMPGDTKGSTSRHTAKYHKMFGKS